MKKLLMFLAGVILLMLIVASLYVVGAIYDAGARRSIDTYFFQTNGQSGMRLGVPASARDLGDDRMREMLIKKYVYEYFYVTPGDANLEDRTGPLSTLRQLSTPAVYNRWQQEQVPEIQQLAKDGAMRMVDVVGPIVKNPDSDFWSVEYQLTTWHTPNDFAARPVVTRGQMLIAIHPDAGYSELRPDVDVEKRLRAGYDPATLFKFMAIQVEAQ